MQDERRQVRLDELRGAPVYDAQGDKIGSVEEIFYDEASGTPEWIGLGTGFFGTKRVLVPVAGAGRTEDGLVVPYDKEQVKSSPDIDSDEISGEAESELVSYYRLGGGASQPQSSSTGDDSVTRHEEELQVGKQSVDAGTARLRKWVETEPVSLDVELRHETARVVREQIDQPVEGDRIGEESVEVPLRAEQPVVAKQTVAKERVGLEKETVSETQTVADEVRKERVEIDGDSVE